MRRAARASVLTRLQRGLEELYRVESQPDVAGFVLDARGRTAAAAMLPARAPREQLLVRESGDELEIGLFVDGAVIENLERHDPAVGLTDGNFWDFCLAVEGVSHFLYLTRCAAGERRVSALELELQAEVDKFICCLLLELEGGRTEELRRRLYVHVRLATDLDAVERVRYQIANDEAHRYAIVLERRYLASRRLGELLAEVRRFYRLDLEGKLERIARLAA